jgi:hypothetical protein
MSESWRAGARVIEGKENALRRQKRKLKWQRIVLSAMAVATMVVCVVAVNSFFYIESRQAADALPGPSTPAIVPDVLTASAVIPTTPGEPIPTQPTVTPEPTASPVITETILPTRDTTPLLVTPPPTPTPKMTVTPTPTPTPKIILTLSPTPTPTPTPEKLLECTDADQSRDRKIIIERFGDIWRRNIEGERRKIIAQNVPAGVQNTEASLGPIEYRTTFFKACLAGVVTVRYVWQVKTDANPVTPGKVVAVSKEKRFACVKIGGAWLCN